MRLLRNLRNKGLCHVHPFNLALSNNSGVLTMRARNEELGDCTSTLLLPRSPESIDVLSVSWADWLRLVQPNPITFIKIDIEGAEFDLIPTMLDYLRMYKPVVHLSLHARFLPADQQRAALDSIYGQLTSIYPDCLDEHLQRLDLAGFHTANQPPSPAVVFAPAS